MLYSLYCLVELENEIQDSTLEGQLRKNEVLLRNVRENIKELHYQIAVAKGKTASMV